MNIKCPNCGEENDETAKYCYACGSSLEGGDEVWESTIGRNEERTRRGRPSVKPRSRGRRALGCLTVLLALLIVLPTVYIFFGRPFVEREILQIARSIIDENPARYEFHGEMTNLTIQEEDINEALSPLWSDIPLIDGIEVDLDQDMIWASLNIFNISLGLGLDIRVNDQGDVLVKTIELNLPTRLLFQENTLRQAVSDIINQEYLRPSNMALKAFQVTDGEIFLTIEER